MTWGIYDPETGQFDPAGYATETDAQIAAENLGYGEPARECSIHLGAPECEESE